MKWLRPFLIVLVGALSLGTAPQTSQAPERLRKEVQAFVKAYVEAQNKVDANALMEMVSQRPGVASISLGEITRGWDGIRTAVDDMIGSEGVFKISLGTTDVETLGPSFVLVYAPCTITAALEGEPVQYRGAASLVLEKTSGKWKVFHEHSSVELPEAEGD